MEPTEFEIMDRVEHDMWWYQGLHANFLWAIDEFCTEVAPVLLDVGCGTGGFLAKLAALSKLTAFGLEYSPSSAARAAAKSGSAVTVGSANELPIAQSALSVIVLGDILCQNTVNFDTAVAEIHRCLRPGGIAIINVPAYPWLRSTHDEQVHAARRYTLSGMQDALAQRGFKVLYGTYWNTFLFPLMVARRKLFPNIIKRSDVFQYPGVLNWLFRKILSLELCIIRNRKSLAFGGSVFVVATKT